MSWFDDNGFSAREDRIAARAAAGANTTQPVGTATPLPGQTIGGVISTVTDPNNARLSGAGGAGGAGEPFSEDAFFNHMERYPPTNEGMRAGYEAAKAIWGNQVPELLEHPHRLDKFRFSDGRTFDVIGGAGGPNPSWVRNLEGPGHGGGAVNTLGALAGGNWQAGMDPSYGFIRDEAQKALQSGAAARGTLLTGGFQKDMAKYISGLASQEFGNIFGRNLSLANLGLDAAGRSAQTGTSYSGQAGSLTNSQALTNAELTLGAGDAQAGATVGNAVNWGNTLADLGSENADALANLRNRWLQPAKGGRSDYLNRREGTV